jgi:hypothetical protein
MALKMVLCCQFKYRSETRMGCISDRQEDNAKVWTGTLSEAFGYPFLAILKRLGKTRTGPIFIFFHKYVN